MSCSAPRSPTGLDPSSDPPRTIIEAGRGQLLLMPSAGATAVGTKVVGLARDNPARGLPTIQAVYVLMDAETLTPQALIDGIALTNLRTPAVSAVAMQALAPDDVESAVIVGSGPQALGHAEALLALRSVRRITVAGRDADRAESCARRIEALAPRGGAAPAEVHATTDGSELEDAVRGGAGGDVRDLVVDPGHRWRLGRRRGLRRRGRLARASPVASSTQP